MIVEKSALFKNMYLTCGQIPENYNYRQRNILQIYELKFPIKTRKFETTYLSAFTANVNLFSENKAKVYRKRY